MCHTGINLYHGLLGLWLTSAHPYASQGRHKGTPEDPSF